MKFRDYVRISSGNIKLGSILNINLPPIITCAKGVPCSGDGCYALKAYRQYPNVRNAWNRNLELFKNNPNFYFNDIIRQLKKKRNLRRFRWHSSGDIVDQNYLNGIIEISKEFPKTSFLVYTKRNDIDFPEQLPSNLSIRFSMWKNYKNKTSLNKKAWISGDHRIPENYFLCPKDCRNCSYCWTSKLDVVFEKH